MKLNDDNKTVAAMDCLVPGIGEIIGGSQREDDYDTLAGAVCWDLRLKGEGLRFYLDLANTARPAMQDSDWDLKRCVMYLNRHLQHPRRFRSRAPSATATCNASFNTPTAYAGRSRSSPAIIQTARSGSV